MYGLQCAVSPLLSIPGPLCPQRCAIETLTIATTPAGIYWVGMSLQAI